VNLSSRDTKSRRLSITWISPERQAQLHSDFSLRYVPRAKPAGRVYVDCLRAVQNNEEYQAMTAIQEPALQLVLPGTDPSYFMEL
jgi:hypothetical protein